MDSWKTKYLFPLMGMIPIDRGGGNKSRAALDTAEAVLRRGELFGIFPEGTRSRDGVLHKGRTGAARLAVKIGCPIYPVGMIGTREIQPPDAKVPKLGGACTIKIGRPINVERYRNRTDTHLVLRQITDELMFEIRDLTGQDYRNVYAGKTAETEPNVVAKVASMTEQPTELVGVSAGK
jgi:1-acyl-sn-glycerol-3-phosphate acyltransferase